MQQQNKPKHVTRVCTYMYFLNMLTRGWGGALIKCCFTGRRTWASTPTQNVRRESMSESEARGFPWAHCQQTLANQWAPGSKMKMENDWGKHPAVTTGLHMHAHTHVLMRTWTHMHTRKTPKETDVSEKWRGDGVSDCQTVAWEYVVDNNWTASWITFPCKTFGQIN